MNEKDEVIGQATKEECHADPKLIHRVVHFTIFDPNTERILMTRRSYNKDHDAGKICILGEHVLRGEKYEDALTRGIQEELGFLPVGTKIFLGKHFVEYNTQKEIAHMYIAEWNGQKIIWDTKEIEEIFWISLSKLFDSGIRYSKMTEDWLRLIDWGKVKI